ncbi:hypothetical protein Tco_0879397 [Tanacetum coccineum]
MTLLRLKQVSSFLNTIKDICMGLQVLELTTLRWDCLKVGYILGRQQKKRKKSVCENILMVNNGKLSRRSKTVTCVLCKTNGHNKSSCKGPATNLGNKRTRSENVGELGRQLRKEKKNDGGEKTGNKGKQIVGGEKTVEKGKQTADVDKT